MYTDEENDEDRPITEAAEEEIRPDFLKRRGGESAKKILGAVENAANAVMAAKGGGGKVGGGKAGGGSAGGGKTGGSGGSAGTQGGESGGIKNSVGMARKAESDPDDPSANSQQDGIGISKTMVIGFLLLGIVFAMGFAIVGMPILMVGAIDYNLQRMLGFDATEAILEQQAEHVTAEVFGEGKVPEGYAADLAREGLIVGQVSLAGNFVPTNEYIPGLEADVAATGPFVATDDGSLAVMFHDRLIRADEFVAAVESDPELYAAYSKAADIGTRYYYSKDVDDVYNDMGLTRGAFNSWQATGDYEVDEERFNTLITNMLDKNASVNTSGRNMDCLDPDNHTEVNGEVICAFKEIVTVLVQSMVGGAPQFGDDGEPIMEEKEEVSWTQMDEGYTLGVDSDVEKHIEEVAEDTKIREEKGGSEKATKQVAELLNMSLSSSEPYLAASAFMAVEESIQRARIGDEGPINHVMNMLTTPTSVSYKDINTGEMVSVSNVSILDTPNFRAAVSESAFSAEEAENFSRDRVLTATTSVGGDIINDTMVATKGKQKTNILTKYWAMHGDEANAEVLKGATEDLELVFSKKGSSLFQNPVGGNRIVEGGSFISNTINMRVGGAMPSDEATVLAYNQRVNEVFARQAEAERATKSPFDISSPNTFLGSIVHKFAVTSLSSARSVMGGASLVTAAKTMAATVGGATNDLVTTVEASGEDNSYITSKGRNCRTAASAANVVGDLYCTPQGTFVTKYMEKTTGDWQDELEGQVDDEGNIEDGSELAEFVVLGMDRGATVGVSSVDVCKRKREIDGDGGNLLKRFVSFITSLFLNGFEWESECDGVDTSVATGAKYTISSSNGSLEDTEMYAGFALHDEVRSLLESKKGAVSSYKESYYARHPKDDSTAGKLARRSGMSVAQAQFLVDFVDRAIAKLQESDQNSL